MKNLDFNKLIGALCVAGLVFLFGKWAATSITSRHQPAAHGEHEVAQAYTIAVEGGGEHGEEEAGIDIGALLAVADPAQGEAVFKKCAACHKLDGSNGTGPHLDGVVDRVVASVEGFSYSDGMIAHGGNWTPEALAEFLANPKAATPGTKMSFAGLKKPEDIANIIAFLTPGFDPANYSAAAPAPAAEGSEAATDDHAAAEPAAVEVAAGDPDKGANVFKKCKACHSVEAGKNGTGPTLFGIVGSKAGEVEGYKFSDAMLNSGLTWDAATLDKYLADVKGVVPGTKMSFAGLKKPEDRADIIAYLETLK